VPSELPAPLDPTGCSGTPLPKVHSHLSYGQPRTLQGGSGKAGPAPFERRPGGRVSESHLTPCSFGSSLSAVGLSDFREPFINGLCYGSFSRTLGSGGSSLDRGDHHRTSDHGLGCTETLCCESMGCRLGHTSPPGSDQQVVGARVHDGRWSMVAWSARRASPSSLVVASSPRILLFCGFLSVHQQSQHGNHCGHDSQNDFFPRSRIENNTVRRFGACTTSKPPALSEFAMRAERTTHRHCPT